MKRFLRLAAGTLLLVVAGTASARSYEQALKDLEGYRSFLQSSLDSTKEPQILAQIRPTLIGQLGQLESFLGQEQRARRRLAELRRLKAHPAIALRLEFWIHVAANRRPEAEAVLQQQDLLMAKELQEDPSLTQLTRMRWWLADRSEWAQRLMVMARWRNDTNGAMQWADVACNYQRLSAMVAQFDDSRAPLVLMRVREADALLREGRNLPGVVESLSCAVDPSTALQALAARSAIKLPVAGPAVAERYGLSAEQRAAPPADVFERELSTHEPVVPTALETEVFDLFFERDAVDRRTLSAEESRPAIGKSQDALCQVYYLQGMYYRYVARREDEALEWLQRAATTWEFTSNGFILARLELGLPAMPRPNAAPPAPRTPSGKQSTTVVRSSKQAHGR